MVAIAPAPFTHDSPIEDEVGGEEHKEGELVPLTGVAEPGDLEGQASQSGTRN